MNLTWQDWLLIAVSVVVGVVVVSLAVYVAIKHLRFIAELRVFLDTITREVGKDGGASIATRLKAQDTVMETARLLAANKDVIAGDGQMLATKDRENLRLLISQLSDQLGRFKEQNESWQKYMEAIQLLTNRTMGIFIDQKQGDSSHTTTHREGGIDLSGNAALTAAQDVIAADKTLRDVVENAQVISPPKELPK